MTMVRRKLQKKKRIFTFDRYLHYMKFQILIAFLSFKFICKSIEFMVKEGSKRCVFDEKREQRERKRIYNNYQLKYVEYHAMTV